MLIGLTGQIGAGKSAVARILATFGAVIIDADQIGRQVVEQSPKLLEELVEVFGADILDAEGHLIRSRLAALAFETDENRAQLNTLIHPHLLRELRDRIQQFHIQDQLVVVDAALLLEWGLQHEVDRVWVVQADEKVRLTRLVERGLSEADARARQALQGSAEWFSEQADLVIDNNGDLESLQITLEKILPQK